jgi:hypothetical protein
MHIVGAYSFYEKRLFFSLKVFPPDSHTSVILPHFHIAEHLIRHDAKFLGCGGIIRC